MRDISTDFGMIVAGQLKNYFVSFFFLRRNFTTVFWPIIYMGTGLQPEKTVAEIDAMISFFPSLLGMNCA